MTEHPIARQTIGYLLVGGGVHQVALTRATTTGLPNVPNMANPRFPETR